MSQHARRALAACGLMAALLLTAPAPSRAAGLWKIPDLVPGITARVRTWLEGLPPGSQRAAAERRIKQGSGVDPNGSTPSTTPGATTNQGSGVDPNGSK